MRYLFIYLLTLSITCFSFVELQYKDTPQHNFEFFTNLGTMGSDAEDGSAEAPTIVYYGINFMFDNIGYGFNIYPITLSDGDTFSWTSHNVYYQLFSDAKFLFLRTSAQLGITNFGLPSSSLDSNFKDFLQQYYLTNKIGFKSNNVLNLYTSTAANQSTEFSFYYGLEYNYGKNRAYVEYTPNQDQVYFGADIYFANRCIFSIATNLTDTDPDIEADYFYPTTYFGIRLINPFVKPPKKKQQVKPLPIDHKSLVRLEKGLLAFYESDYEAALAHYLTVVKKYPSFAHAHIRTGNAYYQLNQIKLAKKHWKLALILEPNNTDVINMLQKLDDDVYLKNQLIN